MSLVKPELTIIACELLELELELEIDVKVSSQNQWTPLQIGYFPHLHLKALRLST